MRRYLLFLIAIFASWLSTAAQSSTQTPALDDGRQWLSTQTIPAAAAPAIVRAAAANARNQPDREDLLLRIIRSQPSSDEARQAHKLLSRIYLREGQYRRLLQNFDRWAQASPDDPALAEEKSDDEQLRGLPDQINGAMRVSRLRHGPENDFAVPISINGKPANYLADTGAWISVMSVAEARRLNLQVRDSTGVLSEPSGKGVTFKTAVARDLVVGSTVFHDVSFAILPDVEPWRSMPVGRAGIIGVPILLHLGCIEWTKGGDWTLGCTSGKNNSAANMVFYKNRILLASSVNGQQVFLTVDTGAETTDLNSNFARQFAGAIKQFGVKDKTSVTGAGGTTVIESISLPVDFRIGAVVTRLRPAHVTMQENPALGGDCCVGNIGLDLMAQTGALSINFQRMTLRLRRLNRN
ncbi:MAG TPA: retroviral-like aspartic protease family protein [Pyrinomonadaceae bacterium]|nr:retroviral-like aspartic protease family protein [Pyrinomonadaceae bacterium]